MSGPRIVVVGDVLLDRDVDGTVERIAPDAPAPVLDVAAERADPGGAGLAALLAARDGADVVLVAPIADDEAGQLLAERLSRVCELVPIGHAGPTRTKTRVRSGGHTLVRLDDGGPGRPTSYPVARLRAVLQCADTVLVSDYGGGVTRDPGLRELLREVADRIIWDPHPRGGTPLPGILLATPNLSEAQAALRALPPGVGGSIGPVEPEHLALRLAAAWRTAALAVTAGSQGAWLAEGRQRWFVPAPAEADGDTCGAGDQLAVSAALSLGRLEPVVEAVARGVADATAWVDAGGVAAFHRRGDTADVVVHPEGDVAGTPTTLAGHRGTITRASTGEELEDLAARLRTRGGRLVATGGCFDVLHAGHVALLEGARRLGDTVVVLVNSDDGVRALKGPGRPAVPFADRARVLTALGCVDHVVEFDEPDPSGVLARLRPDFWVKGGDYDTASLPERDVVEAYGGAVVLLPYLPGRSTTRILARTGPGAGTGAEIATDIATELEEIHDRAS